MTTIYLRYTCAHRVITKKKKVEFVDRDVMYDYYMTRVDNKKCYNIMLTRISGMFCP